MMYRVPGFGSAQRLSDYFKGLAPGLFLRELCLRPGAVGALCPSSRHLARHMAKQVPASGDGLVVELGAGTGVVTQALLDSGVPAHRLLVIEYSGPFVRRLRKRFPHLNVVQGNAADLRRLLPPEARVRAIVSSLPLCSLPAPMTHSILEQWQHLLHDNGVAIQFTYNLRRPKWKNQLRAQQTGSKIIWANLPPANISTFSFKTAKLPAPRHEHVSAEPYR